MRLLHQCPGLAGDAISPSVQPSMPQFVALCEAAKPRESFRPSNVIGMSGELRSKYARQAREINARHASMGRELASGGTGREPSKAVGLQALNLLIAEASGLAGGDEAATLRRMEVRNAAE